MTIFEAGSLLKDSKISFWADYDELWDEQVKISVSYKIVEIGEMQEEKSTIAYSKQKTKSTTKTDKNTTSASGTVKSNKTKTDIRVETTTTTSNTDSETEEVTINTTAYRYKVKVEIVVGVWDEDTKTYNSTTVVRDAIIVSPVKLDVPKK